jgi:hypothetical protein
VVIRLVLYNELKTMVQVPVNILNGVSMDIPNDVPIKVLLKHCSLLVRIFVPSAMVHLFL